MAEDSDILGEALAAVASLAVRRTGRQLSLTATSTLATLKSRFGYCDNCAKDAVLALITLGYKQVDALKAVRAVAGKAGAATEPDELVRQALKALI